MMSNEILFSKVLRIPPNEAIHGLSHDFGSLELTPRFKIGAVQFRPLYWISQILFIYNLFCYEFFYWRHI